MISVGVFMSGLLTVSILTGLVTQAVKTILTEYNVTYRANTLAGIVALVLSAAVGVGYIVMTEIDITPQIIVCIIALVVMGWLCAMVGYDKVVQAIGQFKTTSKE